jgi:hypothetical protein
MKLKNFGEKDTAPGSQAIPHGPEWDQSHVSMVTDRPNDTTS